MLGLVLRRRRAREVAAQIGEAATACLPAGRQFELLGFSNGGYAVDHMVVRCQLATLVPRAFDAITIGAAMLHGPLGAGPPDLSACGHLLLVAGTADRFNYDPHDHYLDELRARGADALTNHVPGLGHEVTDAALAAAFE